MGFLIFLGMVLAGALAVWGITRIHRPNEPVTPVVLLATPLGEGETELIVQRLKAEGMCRTSNDSSFCTWSCSIWRT